VEIYFDADIPISKTSMTQIMRGQNLQLKVLQEVQGHNGEWINVDKTLPTTCQADSCENPPELTAKLQKKDGKKKLYLLCKHHANLVSMGIYFNVVDENE
jgi:hypothetical protein